MLAFRTAAEAERWSESDAGWALPAIDFCFMCIVQSPCHGIQDSCQAVLGHSSSKERISGHGAESIISDLRVGGRGSLVDEIQVGYCCDWGC